MSLLCQSSCRKIYAVARKSIAQSQWRFVSTEPTALSSEEIAASVNKLSQGTPFPWEQVGVFNLLRLRCEMYWKKLSIINYLNSITLTKFRAQVEGRSAITKTFEFSDFRYVLWTASLIANWIFSQISLLTNSTGIVKHGRSCQGFHFWQRRWTTIQSGPMFIVEFKLLWQLTIVMAYLPR